LIKSSIVQPMRNFLFRPIIFVSIVLGIFIIGEFIIMGGLTWRNHQRLSMLEKDIRNGHKLEETIFLLLQNQSHSAPTFIKTDQNLEPIIVEEINRLQHAFAKALDGDTASLNTALETTRQLFARQTREEENLLRKIAEDSQLELQLSIVLPLLAFLIVYVIGHYFFNRNVLLPLNSLKDLLQLLARGDRQPIHQESNDPLMRGVFENYNNLVFRLTELENEQLNYTHELEQKVRKITSDLLEQSQQIARSERLSVVAELAASTAHELRNPLAGIQLALENILQEAKDNDLSERLNAVYSEVKRLTRHLNDLLALTRSTPTHAEDVNLNKLCSDLSLFLKYQIPEKILFNYSVEPNIELHLPETEFRLALLNLLLNAIQAIGPNPGHINLTAVRQQQQVLITIEDNGPGFAKTLLTNGIRPFISMKEKGTGLGLAMVQRFIKSQQGSIRLYNTKAGHACVALSLPEPIT
jgi:signal transduction histidine kinase